MSLSENKTIGILKLSAMSIISKLDIITYISLEDGNICKDFMDINLKSSDSNLKLIKKFMVKMNYKIFY